MNEPATRSRPEVVEAMTRARRKWKDTGDPVWAYVEGALAWVCDGNPTDEIQAVLDGDRVYRRNEADCSTCGERLSQHRHTGHWNHINSDHATKCGYPQPDSTTVVSVTV